MVNGQLERSPFVSARVDFMRMARIKASEKQLYTLEQNGPLGPS